MKRFVAGIMLFAMSLAMAAPVGAVSMTTQNIGWGVTSSSFISPSSGLAVPVKYDKRDVGGNIDTTAVFAIPTGPLGIAPPPATAIAADTLNVGFIRIYSDSSVAVTNTLSSITYTVEGSGDGVTWSTAVASTVRTPASGDVSFVIPVWTRTGVASTGSGYTFSPWLAFKLYRIRITATTGNFFAARCDFIYWTDAN